MADEETGFTFVDKRRAQSAETVEETAVRPESPPAEPDSELLFAADDADDLAEGEAPDVYGIVGYCISLLAAEAWQKLGLLADPKSGQSKPDLIQAKLAIDAVGDLAGRLESAPKDAVPDGLHRDLRNLLNDLRLNYVARRDSGATLG